MLVPSNMRAGSELDLPFNLEWARVVDHVEDRFGRWFLIVSLHGGRILGSKKMPTLNPLDPDSSIHAPPGVRVLQPGAGKGFADRSALPPVGAVGLIAWPAAHRQNRDAVWLGSVDFDAAGGVVAPADASIAQRPDGSSVAVTPDGITTRDVNGDVSFQGSGEKPFEFRVRDEKGNAVPMPAVRRGVNRLFDFALTRLWSLRVAKSLLFQLDPVKRRIAILVDDESVEGLILEDGRARLKTGVLQVGDDPEAAVPVAKWPGVFTVLRNLSRRLAADEARYNRLRAEVQELKAAFLAHTHAGVQPGAASTLAPTVTLAGTSEAAPPDQRGEVVDGQPSVKVLDCGSQSLMAE